jgi:hypothetical protein
MSIRRLPFYLCMVFLAAVLIGFPIKSQYVGIQQNGTELIAGRNVNMVSGQTLPGGDPWLQRQNEPSIAVSTRNPLHLLAGANDYRTVDIPASEGELPGKAQGAMAGDAWVGIYKSFDGGESWVTDLIPGFPQDNSTIGAASPLKQFSTAADPIVRAGTNGLFYYSGMAFNRSQTKGGGSVFVTRFIDDNNLEGTDSIKYLDTSVIEQGTSGQFIDMPRIAVDIPRGAGNVTIDGQSIPKSNIYSAYTVFLGNTLNNIRSRIMFRRSTDCGAAWGSAIKISESQHIIQGATIAIDPSNGAVYVAFRRFLHPSQTNSIVIVKSTDFGQTFSQPVVIADINPFDQPVTDAGGDGVSDPLGTSFRTNSYPTIAVDNTGIVYVAWTERGRGPNGAARIVMATSQGGTGWTAPAVIESPQEPGHMGHQFMPYLTFAAGKLMMAWYDQRNSVGANGCGWDGWISDGMPVRQTVDVRAAQANPGISPIFEKSMQVSRYYFTLKENTDGTYTAEQAQFNPPNYPLFKGGTVPFHGDYVEMTPSPVFVLGASGWSFNTTPSTAPAPPVFHVVWTDNRDVRPPDAANNYDWTNYTPPASNQGDYGNKTSCAPLTVGMRNQNIYTASLTRELDAAAPGNAKSLGNNLGYYDNDPANGLIRRAFAIYVKNTTGLIKNVYLEIMTWPASGGASFLEFSTLHSLDVQVAPYSTIARTVFVWSTNNYDTAKVEVSEGGVSWGTVVLNPDPTNPAPGNTLGSEEIHNPNIVNPNIVNWPNPNIVNWPNPNIVNPNIVNPNIVNFANPNIVNPNIVNPNIVNPNIVNPNIVNPNIVNPNIVNPNIVNPNIVNPNIVNPNIVNPNIEDAAISDVNCTVVNEGNTVSAYTLRTFSKEAFPAGLYLQLLVYKVTTTPSGGVDITGDSCALKEERHQELLLNVTNPNIVNPNIVNPNIVNPNIVNEAIENASFSLKPGEKAEVTLRVIDLNPSQVKALSTGKIFSLQTFVDSLGFAVTAQAVNTTDAQAGNYVPPAAASKLVIGTASLPDGVVNQIYNATLLAYGGSKPYTWSLNSGELPPGLSLGSGGTISGAPTTAGTYHFIVRVDDSSNPAQFDTQQYSIYVDSDQTPDVLTITTLSPLPSGVQGYWYGATLEAIGGVSPRTWTLNPGSNPLPPGLGLDSGGVISGTPTTYGTFPFTVRVTDKNNSSSTKSFTLTINSTTTTYYTISGTVYDEHGNPLSGVVLRGLPNTPITGSNGTYQDSVPAGWSGTATPFMVGHSFTPSTRAYSNQSASQSGQDYSAVPIVGAASKLVFTQSPNGGVGGVPWTMQPIVEVQDADGNVVTSDNSTEVTLKIQNNLGNGSLSGSVQLTVTDGVATFAGLYIAEGGYGYTLAAISNPPLSAATSESFNVEGFSQRAPMSIARDSHTVTYLYTDKILIAGGQNFGGFSREAELYDAETNSYTPLPVMHELRGLHTATLLLDNKVLIAGGDGTSTAELFDPASNAFALTGSMNYWRYGQRATLLQDGRVLITGGGDIRAEIYDPAIGIFSLAGSMQSERYYHTATRLPDGRVLITGGRHPGSPPVLISSAEIYDPSSGTFTLIGNMAGGPRAYHEATLMNNGTILITGGSSQSSLLPTDTAEVYDPEANTFTAVGPMKSAHMSHQAVLLRDGTVLIAGEGAPELFDPLSGQFRFTGPCVDASHPRNAAVTTKDGLVFISGGAGTDGYGVASAVMWNPLNPFPTHVISGHVMANAVPVPGVLLAGLPGLPLTDQGGYYEGVVLDGWTGMVTPTKPGYTFDPVSKSYTNVIADMSGQDYGTTAAPTYTISGTVTVGTASGPPLEGVVMTGLPGDPTTNVSGQYTATVNSGWSGTVTPTLDHYHFIPPSQPYSNVISNQTTDYTAQLTQYQLNIHIAGTGAGLVTSADGGIFCGGTCAHTYDYGTSVVLTATSGLSSSFAGWTEDVPAGHESDNQVTITIDGNKNVTATFNQGGAVTKLAFAQQPGGGAADKAWSVQPVVEVQDIYGGTITTDNTTEVTLSIASNPGNGVLAGIKTLRVSSGVAAFSGLEIYKPGNGYTLTAASLNNPSLTSATSTAFNVSSPPGMTSAEWVKRYEGANQDFPSKVVTDSYGNVYVTGFSVGTGTGKDFYTVKYDNAGNIDWQARYNNDSVNGDDSAVAIVLDAQGNAYVTGSSAGSGTGLDYYTIKYDSAGTVVWAKRYNNDSVNSDDVPAAMAITLTGNIIVTGSSNGSGAVQDIYTIAYDSSGNKVRDARENFAPPSQPKGAPTFIDVDAASNVYITGYSYIAHTNEANRDYCTIKYNSTGIREWYALYNGPYDGPTGNPDYFNDDYAKCLAIDADGNVYVTGQSAGSSYRLDDGFDIVTVKYNSSGTQQWVVRENWGLYDYGERVGIDSARNIIVAGESGALQSDYFVTKYEPVSENRVWSFGHRIYAGPGAGFDYVSALVVDPSDNIYITGCLGWDVHFPASGDFATVKYDSAGNELWARTYNGPGNSGDYARAMAVDPLGNVYVTGYSGGTSTGEDYCTIKYNPVSPLIHTVAGNGTQAYAGDNGPATSASLNNPRDVAFDQSGNLYIADGGNQRVRKVDASGTITTVAGNGTAGYSGDGGSATSATLRYPESVVVDTTGNLYIADSNNNVIRKVDTGGIITTVPATVGVLNFPSGLALDASGNLYIADSGNNRVRKVDTSGTTITTVAGTGTAGFSGDGGPATGASLNNPYGVGFDSSGNLYIADRNNQRIRKVSVGSGIISTVAGNGTQGFSGDGGPALSASFYWPRKVVVNSAGSLFIADEFNNRVRKVDGTTGNIFTVAGDGGSTYNGDGRPATTATLATPWSVILDKHGDLYITVLWQHRIRKVGDN